MVRKYGDAKLESRRSRTVPLIKLESAEYVYRLRKLMNHNEDSSEIIRRFT